MAELSLGPLAQVFVRASSCPPLLTALSVGRSPEINRQREIVYPQASHGTAPPPLTLRLRSRGLTITACRAPS
jgi:hypothetical protein